MIRQDDESAREPSPATRRGDECALASAHTPGPWAAFTDDSGPQPHTNIVAFSPRTDCVFSLPFHDKREPNVMLATAAPDLLAALKDCLGWHDFADDLHKPIEVRAAYMRARAAIAKAEGHSQAGTAERLEPLREALPSNPNTSPEIGGEA